MQRARLWELTGSTEDAPQLAEALQAVMGDAGPEGAMGRLAYARTLLTLGRAEAASDLVDDALCVRVFELGDRTMFEELARLAAHRGDAALGARLIEALAEDEGQLVTDGVLGLVWRVPVSLVLAFAAEAVGDRARAFRWASAAAAQAEAAGGLPTSAEAHLEAARLADDDAAARRHHDAARALIDRLGLEGLRWRLDPSRPPEPASTAAPSIPRFVREGDVWRIEIEGDTVAAQVDQGPRGDRLPRCATGAGRPCARSRRAIRRGGHGRSRRTRARCSMPRPAPSYALALPISPRRWPRPSGTTTSPGRKSSEGSASRSPVR